MGGEVEERRRGEGRGEEGEGGEGEMREEGGEGNSSFILLKNFLRAPMVDSKWQTILRLPVIVSKCLQKPEKAGWLLCHFRSSFSR